MNSVSLERSKTVKVNTIYTFILKGMNLGCLYLMVPLQIGYLNTYNYGIWITVFSMFNWFQFLDIGLGNGLRNRYAQSIANNDIKLARYYVSTTYFLISLISLGILTVFLFASHFVNWCAVFNIETSYAHTIYVLIIVIFGSIIINFPLKVISSILNGAQRSALANSFSPVANVISLLAMMLLVSRNDPDNLLKIGIIYAVVPLILFLVVSIYFFSFEFKDIRPSYAYVEKKYIKDLTGLGVKFFILQLNAVILFTTDAFVIAQLLGQVKVAEFNVMFRLYSLPFLLFQIIIIPYWSAFTHAYEQKDMEWIKTIMKKLMVILVVIIIMLLIIFSFNNLIFKFWVKNKIHVNLTSGFLFVIYFAFYSAMTPFVNFINGVGKIKLQLYIACIVSIVNIPLAIFLTKRFAMGINGSIVSGILCIAPFTILMGMQTYKIIKGTSGTSKCIWYDD